ncbi:hypothetical protein AAMO2058_000161800 [Amorphochlora amoebiformis]
MCDCVKMLEETHMEAVLTRARDLNITTENIEKIANFLENTSAEKFMQAQIRAAAALKDIGRKVEISIRLKKWYIEKYTEQFELQSYTRLRTKQGWANLKLLTMNREALAQVEYSPSSTPKTLSWSCSRPLQSQIQTLP